MPITHIPVRIEDDAVRWDVTHTLVVATRTVASGDLIAAAEAAGPPEQPHRYTIISPPSGEITREEVCERLARTLAELYRAEIDATGQPMSPAPLAAVQNAIEHYRIDEILISTLAGEQSKWLEEGLIDSVAALTDKPVEHVEARRRRRRAAPEPAAEPGRGGRRMESASMEAHDRATASTSTTGRPRPTQSSRIDRQTLGILLFIVSEVMLFGAFFASYFFLRVVANVGPVAAGRARPPEGRRRGQHRDPGLLELHGPLGARVDPRGQPPRDDHWASALTLLLGATFLFIQINEYVHLGFSARDGAFGSIFYGLTGLHGAHVTVGLILLAFANIRAWRGHFRRSRRSTSASRCPGIYWHFVDVMWIIVFTTVYIL